jgi:putative sterol carrier protein
VGAAVEADLVVETDMETFFALATGQLELRSAVKCGQALVEGSREARERCFRVLSLAPRVGAAA